MFIYINTFIVNTPCPNFGNRLQNSYLTEIKPLLKFNNKEFDKQHLNVLNVKHLLNTLAND